MVSKAHDMLQKARVQGTNDIRNFIDPETAPDPEHIEDLSESDAEDVVEAVVQADENIVEALNALYQLKNMLA